MRSPRQEDVLPNLQVSTVMSRNMRRGLAPTKLTQSNPSISSDGGLSAEQPHRFEESSRLSNTAVNRTSRKKRGPKCVKRGSTSCENKHSCGDIRVGSACGGRSLSLTADLRSVQATAKKEQPQPMTLQRSQSLSGTFRFECGHDAFRAENGRDRSRDSVDSVRSLSRGKAALFLSVEKHSMRCSPGEVMPPLPFMPCVASPVQHPRKLRVAIFNAAKVPRLHPAASTCYEALNRTPWFLSQAVARLVGLTPSAGAVSRLSPITPVLVEFLSCADIRAGRLEGDGAKFCATPTPFDVLLVPGGSANKDSCLLGSRGRQAVQRFVRNGGGYCGVCAGAFLALCEWRRKRADSLGLVGGTLFADAPHVRDDAHLTTCGKNATGGYCRAEISCGSGLSTSDGVTDEDSESDAITSSVCFADAAAVERERGALPVVGAGSAEGCRRRRCRDPLHVDVRFSGLGRRLLWAEGRPHRQEPEESKEGLVRLRYHNGPLLVAALKGDSSAPCTLGTMQASAVESPSALLLHQSSTTSPGGSRPPAPPPGLNGAAAVVLADVGLGRVILISPHPESTQSEGFGHEPGKPRLRRVLQRAVLQAAAGPMTGRRWIPELSHIPA